MVCCASVYGHRCYIINIVSGMVQVILFLTQVMLCNACFLECIVAQILLRVPYLSKK